MQGPQRNVVTPATTAPAPTTTPAPAATTAPAVVPFKPLPVPNASNSNNPSIVGRIDNRINDIIGSVAIPHLNQG